MFSNWFLSKVKEESPSEKTVFDWFKDQLEARDFDPDEAGGIGVLPLNLRHKYDEMVKFKCIAEVTGLPVYHISDEYDFSGGGSFAALKAYEEAR